MSNIFEDGDRLPAAAKAIAITSYTQFLDRYPIARKIESERWDFIITIAGAFVAISQLNHENISNEDKEALLDRVSAAAIKVYHDFIEACDDCTTFVDRTYDDLAATATYQDNKQFLFSDSLGGWITSNLFKHAPSDDEAVLIRPIGVFVVSSFFNWWKKSA